MTQECVINILNLPRRTDRRDAVTLQMEMEKATYVFWNGVEGKNPIHNINKAFKSVIQFYKNQPTDRCFIAEDDLRWTGTGAWKFFLDNMPDSFDIYTGSYYSGSHDENFIVKDFAGMTLVCVHKRYYDTFLSLPADRHIDRAIAASGAKIVVCTKFVAVQAPGYSDQRRREANDSHRLIGKEMFEG
jgi:hypothetical protein